MEYSVAYLDDSEDLRLLLSELALENLDLNMCCFSRLTEMQASSAIIFKTKLVLLDINLGLGEPNGIDAYDWLMENRYKGKIIFFTGHAQNHPRVHEAMSTGLKVLEKPVKTTVLLAEIADAVRTETIES